MAPHAKVSRDWAVALVWLILGLLCPQLGCDRHETPPAPAAESTADRGQQLAAQNISHGDEPAPAAKDGSLPRYELQMAPADVAALMRGFSNDTHPATFKAEGKVYTGVKVRVRGAWSRSWPKKSLKIQFDKGTNFAGHHTLNLNSGWRDPAFVREPLAYHVYAVCGAPAPTSRMVRLDINGRFAGLYVEVEQPEKGFLRRVNLPGASLYKTSSRGRDADERDLGSEDAYRACYDKETQKVDGYGELKDFCHELETTSSPLDFFNKHVALDRYINYLAATVLIQHWDGFNKNHLMLFDGRGSHKWFVVPWDLDRTFGDHWNGSFTEARLPILLGTRRLPGITGWNRLEERFFSEPSLRARFLDRLSELLDKEFTSQKLFPILDRMETEISADAANDRHKWPNSDPDFGSGIRDLKTFIEERRAYLLKEVPRLRRASL